MPKINEVRYEGKVCGMVRSKAFASKQVHEFSLSLYAGKNKAGDHQSVFIPAKYWGEHPPERGDIVICEGRLTGNKYAKADGTEVARVEFTIEKWERNQEQTTPRNPPTQHSVDKSNAYSPKDKETVGDDQLPF